MKKSILFLFIIMTTLTACVTQPKNTSSVSVPSVPELSGTYSKIEYDGFDASTASGMTAREITGEEDIDSIIKSLAVSHWEFIPDPPEATEQVIELNFYKEQDISARIVLYFGIRHEYALYQGHYFLVPKGTYQHAATLLQSYGFQVRDGESSSFSLSVTLELLLENPGLKIYGDGFSVKVEEHRQESYLSALSPDTWTLLHDHTPYKELSPGESVYFTSSNTELSISDYGEVCLAEISTKMNQFVYVVPKDTILNVRQAAGQLPES